MAYDCDIIIAGGGPIGLFLAAELGMRGLCIKVFDDKPGTSTHPAANANSARTMEHYRRLGIAKKIRGLGLPGDHPTDVAYFTRLSQHELARLSQPSSDEAVAMAQNNEFTWPTPEPLHRCSQLYIEPVLLDAAQRNKNNHVYYHSRVIAVEQDESHVQASVQNTESGETKTWRGKYLIGCDGPRSTVRGLLGLHYVGTAGEKREFMGGKMSAAYFRSPALYALLKDKRAWQYWTLNAVQRALIVSVDGQGSFIINIQARDGQATDDHDVGRYIANAIGTDLPFELLSNSAWTAGFALVAEKMKVGRVFLAGDAAHLFTPTGGLGYNTGIEDAANLAWKLEAMVKGYGGPSLADSYEAERVPAARRNTEFAREFADSIGHVRLPGHIEEDSERGAAARLAVGRHLAFHAHKEFVIPGVQLGTRYEGSPLVSTEAGNPPPDTANLYLPVARPGHRAPHIWLDDGSSIYDHFGQGFTLLRFGHAASEALDDGLHTIPGLVTDLLITSDAARDLYGADYVLVRPDQHIAWRGNQIAGFVQEALDKSLGFSHTQ